MAYNMVANTLVAKLHTTGNMKKGNHPMNNCHYVKIDFDQLSKQ